MRKIICLSVLLALLMPACALAEYDAQAMQTWLSRFCEALASLEMIGDPALTADPARPGEYLLEYAFGTVTATTSAAPQPDEIVEIDVRTQQVTDCRGIRVGMSLEEATGGQVIGRSNTQLYVLSTQEAGLGFAWAYLGDSGVYGVEYITYGGSGAAMREYTLTYVLDDSGAVGAIRVRTAAATQAQAQQAMDTAEEIAQRQRGEVFAVKNDQPMLTADDLQVMGVRALGMQAAELVWLLGEPVEVQTLPEGRGRLLLYEGATVELGLNVQTGEEIVRGVSVSGSAVGPRALLVGMSVQEAASLFRCDADVNAVGGVLYMEGEAAGEAPCGELVQGELSAEATLRYRAIEPSTGGTVTLEIGVREGTVTHWHFFDEREGTEHGI